MAHKVHQQPSSADTVSVTSSGTAPPNLEWFKHYWYIFHMSAIMAPSLPTPEEFEQWRVFYVVFGKSIPCVAECQGDYFRIIQTVYPFRYANADDLFRWTVDVHNEVNAKLGKKPIPYDVAKKAILEPSSSTPARPGATGATKSVPTRGSKNDSHDKKSQQKKFPIWIVIGMGVIVIAIFITLMMRNRTNNHIEGNLPSSPSLNSSSAAVAATKTSAPTYLLRTSTGITTK